MNIYADFNGIEQRLLGTMDVAVDMTSYGTLASLSLNKLILRVGQILQLSDEDGLTVEAEVFFDKKRMATNCSGWFAAFTSAKVITRQEMAINFSGHICFSCRRDITWHLDQVGRQYHENCPYCATPVMVPLFPPTKNKWGK